MAQVRMAQVRSVVGSPRLPRAIQVATLLYMTRVASFLSHQ
jgi:hypothetical protein